MALPVFAIRPQPGLAATMQEARRQGIDVEGEALFEIRDVEWSAPDPADVDALLVGSANAFRHGGPQLSLFQEKPVHAVGKTTAAVAEAAGFHVARVGTGGLQGLIDGLDMGVIGLLRLAGAERVPLAMPPQVKMIERIVYAAATMPMSPEMANGLANGGIVMLHSAAAARHFHEECARLGLDRGKISLASLGPRISDTAGTGWRELRHAVRPDETALLALVKDMCQGRRDSRAT